MIILISRSGSTAGKLLNQLPTVKKKDIRVISNNFDNSRLDSFFHTQHPIEILKHKDIEKKLLLSSPTQILLIGYLRILSKEVCERHEIYNIHPADIVNHPELKGKDPIERVYEKDLTYIQYPKLGVILHKVTSKVDEGPILYLETFPRPKTIAEAYLKSDEIAVNLWKKLLDSF